MDKATSQAELLEAAAVEIDRMAAHIDELHKAAKESIAIVGIGLRLPGGIECYSDFVRTLLVGTRITPCSVADRWGEPNGGDDWPVYAIESVDKFDADHFGISGSEAAAMDPQHRLLMTCAAEALEDAGIIADPSSSLDGGVFIGQCFDEHAIELSRRAVGGGLDTYSVVGAARNLATTRLARAFGLEGPAASIDASCASSLMAAHLAMQSLRSRECDFAMIAGVNLVLSSISSEGFSKLGVLSPSRHCRPFSQDADGYVRGEGVIVLVAMRASDTGDRRIYGMLEHSASGQNGFTGSLIAPKGSAQAKVISKAWRGVGGIQNDIRFVEAQAVGNRMGDAIEMHALNGVAENFGRAANDPIKLTSVKRVFGHLEGAAGCASLIAAFAQLEGEVCAVNPAGVIEFDDARFEYVAPAQSGEKLSKATGGIMKAGVSGFGMSGLNVHMIVSLPSANEHRASIVSGHFAALAVSAQNEDSCRQQARALAKFLSDQDELDIVSVAASLATGRRLYPFRIAIPISPDANGKSIADQLEAIADTQIRPCTKPDHIHVRVAREASAPISTNLLDAFNFWSRLSIIPVTFEGLAQAELERFDLAPNPFDRDAPLVSAGEGVATIDVENQNIAQFVARFLEVAQFSPQHLKHHAPARPKALPFFQFNASHQPSRNRQPLVPTYSAYSAGGAASALSDVLDGDILAMAARHLRNPELISDAVSIETLGLDSLAIMQLVQEIEDSYGVAIGLADYDDLHSVGDLARAVRRKQLVRNMISDQREQLSSDLIEITL